MRSIEIHDVMHCSHLNWHLPLVEASSEYASIAINHLEDNRQKESTDDEHQMGALGQSARKMNAFD